MEHKTSEESVLALRKGDRVLYRRKQSGGQLEEKSHKATVETVWLCLDAIMVKVKPDHEEHCIDLWHEYDIIDKI